MNLADMPLWATVLERAITLIILTGLAMHAYKQYRVQGSKMLVSRRCAFFMFCSIFIFGAAANSVAIMSAIEFNKWQGPYNYGMFSMLMSVIYLVFLGRVTYRGVRF